MLARLDAVAGRVLQRLTSGDEGRRPSRCARSGLRRRDGRTVEIIDQTRLPHELVIARLQQARRCGARDPRHAGARRAADRRHRRLWHGAGDRRGPVGRGDRRRCRDARRDPPDRGQPALGARRRCGSVVAGCRPSGGLPRRSARAGAIADEDVAINRAIGEHGAGADRGGLGASEAPAPVEVLTHCNAGWLATVDWGTALAPIYRAHDAGIPLHVWVDETRPRNQGASLTAWELGQHGVPHTVIADNAGGHLMRAGRGRSVHRRHRPHDGRRRRRQQDRHLPEGAGGARQRRAVLCRAAVADDRLGDRGRRGDPDRARDPREVTHIAGWTEDGRRVEVRLTPETARPRISPST